NAPVHTVSVSADYEHPEALFRDVRGFIRVEDNFRTSYRGSTNPDNADLEGYNLVNFRAGLRADNFELSAFVENAFDKSYATGVATATLPGQTDPFTTVTVGPSRVFGLLAKVRF
ncbi:MAG: hypothetical protein AAF317_02975, partial [Pseudomonadota bacterium]